MFKNRYFKVFVWICLAFLLLYGAGRAYYALTAGFAVSEITSDLPRDPKFDIKPLDFSEKTLIHSILSKNFYYLGKGIQSYAFLSEDGEYVIKFLKFKHLRPAKLLQFFSFIPAVQKSLNKSIEIKQKKIEYIFTSWKIAYEDLKSDTALIYIHINQSDDLKSKLTIYDRMGFKSVLDLDNFVFLIQKRAIPLRDTIEEEMRDWKTDHARVLIDNIIKMILSEFNLGIGDNDPTLMQNTGILNDRPMHIDVGDFTKNESFKEKSVQDQELFNKTYKFRIWLKKNYPELQVYLDQKLFEIIGPKIHELKPVLTSFSTDM